MTPKAVRTRLFVEVLPKLAFVATRASEAWSTNPYIFVETGNKSAKSVSPVANPITSRFRAGWYLT